MRAITRLGDVSYLYVTYRRHGPWRHDRIITFWMATGNLTRWRRLLRLWSEINQILPPGRLCQLASADTVWLQIGTFWVSRKARLDVHHLSCGNGRDESRNDACILNWWCSHENGYVTEYREGCGITQWYWAGVGTEAAWAGTFWGAVVTSGAVKSKATPNVQDVNIKQY